MAEPFDPGSASSLLRRRRSTRMPPPNTAAPVAVPLPMVQSPRFAPPPAMRFRATSDAFRAGHAGRRAAPAWRPALRGAGRH